DRPGGSKEMSSHHIDGRAVVSRVDLYRYVCPVHASRSHLPSFGLVVRLRAKFTDQEIVGIGESFVLADQANSAWELLTELGKNLLGAEITKDFSTKGLIADVSEWHP